METPRVSVIIPHLNTPELLVRTLQSLVAQRLDHGWAEIIVVDNGSRMPLDAIAAAWPDVRFLREPVPGPGPARNLGVAHAHAPVLAFIDADIRADSGWLQQAVDAVEATPGQPVGGDVRIGFVDPARPTGIEAFEAVFSFRQRMYIKRKGFSGTGNLAVHRDLLAKVGPFAPIGVAEDRDWGLRARAMGHVTRYVPEMRVFHPARSDMEELKARWSRLIAHKFTEHQERGKSMLRWDLEGWAVLASAFAQTPMLLLSPRITGVSARFRGIATLFETRGYRFMKMRRIARDGGTDSAMQWNRGA